MKGKDLRAILDRARQSGEFAKAAPDELDVAIIFYESGLEKGYQIGHAEGFAEGKRIGHEEGAKVWAQAQADAAKPVVKRRRRRAK